MDAQTHEKQQLARRLSQRTVFLWSGIAVAGLIGTGMYLASDRGHAGGAVPEASTKHHASVLAVEPMDKVGENRCPTAKTQTSVTDLRKASTTPIYLPDDVRPTAMWTCEQIPFVMFGPIQIMFDPGWEKIDPAEKWPALVRDDGGRIETIAGRPAYVHPGTPGTRSAVRFIVNGTSVLFLAEPDTPVEKLIEFAKSIKFPAEAHHDYVPFDPKTDPDINPDLRNSDACDIEALENCHQ